MLVDGALDGWVVTSSTPAVGVYGEELGSFEKESEGDTDGPVDGDDSSCSSLRASQSAIRNPRIFPVVDSLSRA